MSTCVLHHFFRRYIADVIHADWHALPDFLLIHFPKIELYCNCVSSPVVYMTVSIYCSSGDTGMIYVCSSLVALSPSMPYKLLMITLFTLINQTFSKEDLPRTKLDNIMYDQGWADKSLLISLSLKCIRFLRLVKPWYLNHIIECSGSNRII